MSIQGYLGKSLDELAVDREDQSRRKEIEKHYDSVTHYGPVPQSHCGLTDKTPEPNPRENPKEAPK